jgi:uncharacterized protein (TIGR03792 family)
MIIEWLRFGVPADLREAFIQKDEEVWTEGMKKFTGFLGKEVWIDPERSEVVFVIQWESKLAWKSVPQSEIDRLDSLMEDLRFPIVESRAYQVRRFLHH